jgi:hypothetical protein
MGSVGNNGTVPISELALPVQEQAASSLARAEWHVYLYDHSGMVTAYTGTGIVGNNSTVTIPVWAPPVPKQAPMRDTVTAYTGTGIVGTNSTVTILVWVLPISEW